MFKFLTADKDLRNETEKTYYKHIFYIAMACFIFIFFLMAFITNGESFDGLFFNNNSDTFMDHYNSVVYTDIDPYENGVIYPPLATFTYGCLRKIIPADFFNSIVSDPTILSQPKDMKSNQGFIFQFLIFSVAVVFMLLATVYLCKKGSTCEKAFFSFLMLFSAPMMYAFERGNNIVIPLIFSLIFVNYYDSKNKVLKEFALISLGIAVAFKLYPIAFGVLLFRNKQYKELFRAGIYCCALIILPFFLFYDGFQSIDNFLTRIQQFDDKRSTAVNINGQLSFKSMVYYVAGFLRIKLSNIELVATIFRYAITGLCIAGTFFVKSNWKAAVLCACFICGYQGSCPRYLLIFFFVPILMFIDCEKKKSWVNYVCLIFLILIVAPMALPDPNVPEWTVYTSGKVSSLSMLAVAFIIIGELIFVYLSAFVKYIKKKAKGVKNTEIQPASLPVTDGGDTDVE